jgi:hypothetical protein
MVEDGEDGGSIGWRNFLPPLPAFRSWLVQLFLPSSFCTGNTGPLGIDFWLVGTWRCNHFRVIPLANIGAKVRLPNVVSL